MRAVNQCPWQKIPKIFQRFIYCISVIYFMSSILLPFCIYFFFFLLHLFTTIIYSATHCLSWIFHFLTSYLFLAVCGFSSKVKFHTNDFLKISTTPAYLRLIWPLWVKANGRVTKFLLSDLMEIFLSLQWEVYNIFSTFRLYRKS